MKAARIPINHQISEPSEPDDFTMTSSCLGAPYGPWEMHWYMTPVKGRTLHHDTLTCVLTSSKWKFLSSANTWCIIQNRSCTEPLRFCLAHLWHQFVEQKHVFDRFDPRYKASFGSHVIAVSLNHQPIIPSVGGSKRLPRAPLVRKGQSWKSFSPTCVRYGYIS